ncbi:MAG: hypothetical protein U0L91_03600 [Gemmiger sp.]|uniref:InlB B-repeat-containing protein n=1 Tax=Gemmiger sp. TaxID=2049027 RepID=UPI002E75A123|nr:InlB B-repeat-containing protein [Gemmiger sp.]MEE0800347.1 hypothetical protein [Gemmiger sp.]
MKKTALLLLTLAAAFSVAAAPPALGEEAVGSAQQAAVQAEETLTYAVPDTNIVLTCSVILDEEAGHALEVTGCNDDAAGILRIPEQINGLPVRVLDWSSLTRVHDLVGIIVPEGVETLTSFFFTTGRLQFIYLPASLRSIEEVFPVSWPNAPTEIFFGGTEDQTFETWRQDSTLNVGLFTTYTSVSPAEGVKIYYNVDPSRLCTVTLETNGRTPDWYSEKYYLGDPSALCYGYLGGVTDAEFLGWFTAPTGGEEVTKDSPLAVAGDHTIYAHYREDDEAHYTGWKTENGKQFWYENGVKQGTTGRGKEIYDPDSDAWYWLDAIQGGAKAVDKEVYMDYEGMQGDPKWVRYDPDGRMVKGWYTNENGTYYYDLISGAMTKGDILLEGVHYGFDTATGVMLDKAWLTIDGGDYWYEGGIRQGCRLNADGTPDLSYRGKEIYDPASDAWYWLDNVDCGKKAVSKDVYMESEAGAWADRPDGTGKWVRYDAEGRMIKGEHCQNGSWYRFDPIYGSMIKGWYTEGSNSWYYDRVTGVMQHGALVLDGWTYYLDNWTGLLTAKTYGVGAAWHSRGEVEGYLGSLAVSSSVPQMARAANLNAPYDAGALTDDSQQKALNVVKAIRYLAGLSTDVVIDASMADQAQHAAMVSAANGMLSHSPICPSGMDSATWNLAAAGASRSNLSYTMRLNEPMYNIIMRWMADSSISNIQDLGHRRWILNPSMGRTGFGWVSSREYGTFAAMYAIDHSNQADADLTGVAWPGMQMPTGYFSDGAWSYSAGRTLNRSDVTVTLTRTSGTPASWNFSASGSDGAFYVSNGGYGLRGCVIFIPSGLTARAGDSFRVVIRNGGELLADYPVEFF